MFGGVRLSAGKTYGMVMSLIPKGGIVKYRMSRWAIYISRFNIQ